MRTSVAAVLLVGAAQGVGAFMPSAAPCLRASGSSRAVCAASKQAVVMQEQGQASRREAIGTAFAAGLATLIPGAVSPISLGRVLVHDFLQGPGLTQGWAKFGGLNQSCNRRTLCRRRGPGFRVWCQRERGQRAADRIRSQGGEPPSLPVGVRSLGIQLTLHHQDAS